MTSPARRIWLYPDGDAIEVSIFGTLTEIGSLFAQIKTACDRWRGFSNVEIIGNGSTVGVLRGVLTSAAQYGDPVAEIMTVFDEAGLLHRFDWHTTGASKFGCLGTWDVAP